jgi:hypothetical protein
LTPRAGEAQTPTPSTGPKGGQTTTSGTAPDLSPRAPGAGQNDGSGPHSPTPEEAQLGLPDQWALGDILGSTGTTDGTAVPDGVDSPPAGEAAPDSGPAGHSRWPLTAGLIVTLAILFFGGGFLWWRNRDSQYWPA